MVIKGYAKLHSFLELEPNHQIQFSTQDIPLFFFGGGRLIPFQRMQSPLSHLHPKRQSSQASEQNLGINMAMVRLIDED